MRCIASSSQIVKISRFEPKYFDQTHLRNARERQDRILLYIHVYYNYSTCVCISCDCQVTNLVHPQSSQLVEERRQRLQEYLRFIFTLCSTQALVPNTKIKDVNSSWQPQPIFPVAITKAKLIDLFPFFK